VNKVLNVMSLEKKLEYASIGFSALGAVLATATQQLAYLATPVTLALILNLSNRQKEIVKANTRMAKLELSVLDYIQPNLNEFRDVQSSLSNL
jgi:hypothetical protein